MAGVESKLILEKDRICNAFALVIINKEFRSRRRRSFLPNRPSAEKDSERSINVCQQFGFTVNDKNDLSSEEMEALFKAMSKRDFSSNDAFICFISSHGEGEGIYCVDSQMIFVEDILKDLEEVPSLVGKPKIFFIQNCRGRGVDMGVEADGPISLRICLPKRADFLVAYASSEGYEAYRNTEDGSWFIKALTTVLGEKASDMSLTEMLTLVNKSVADMETIDGRKQMPCFTSSLRKTIYFSNKHSK